MADETLNHREVLAELRLPSPPLTGVTLIALAGVAGVWALHRYALPGLPEATSMKAGFTAETLRYKLLESGAIPYALLFVAFGGITHAIGVRLAKIGALRRTGTADASVVHLADQRRYQELHQRVALLDFAPTGYHLGYYAARFKALYALFSEDHDRVAVEALKDALLDADDESMASDLVPLTFVEWTLPLLGFLGTVLGIATAIGGVRRGVETLFASRKLDESVLGHFNDGFAGLSLAFDTTFFGLAFLIVVGVGHFWLRRTLISHMADARRLFSEYVAHLRSPSDQSVVVAVGGLERQIQGLVALSTESKLARDRASGLLQQIVLQAPNLDWVRDILLQPQVEFSRKWGEAALQLQKSIQQEAGNEWRVASIAPSNGSACVFALLIERSSGRGSEIIIANLETAEFLRRLDGSGCRRLFVAANAVVFAQGHDGRMLAVTSSGVHTDGEMDPGDFVTLAAVNGRSSAFWVHRGASLRVNEYVHADRANWVERCVIGSRRHWSGATVHSPSGTLVAWESVGGKASILVRDLATLEAGEAMGARSSRIEVPDEISVRHVVALGRRELLLLDMEGDVHFWNVRKNFPVRLKHNAWPARTSSTVFSGHQNWFAAIQADRLTMWKVMRPARLTPYLEKPEGLGFRGLDVSSLVTSLDGRYLVGCENQLVATWEFPLLNVDEPRERISESRHDEETSSV